MQTTIDAGGRVVIPKAMRAELGLEPGAGVVVEVRDGRVEIRPAPLEVDLEERDGVLVAVPRGPAAPLTAAEVRDVLEQVRR